MLMIIYTDTPGMGKALKALKTWLELSAEHLEQSNDLDIVLLSYPIVFFLYLLLPGDPKVF